MNHEKPAATIRPCPLCKAHLEPADGISTRTQRTFVHPDNGCWLVGLVRITISDHARDHERERLALWNERPDWLRETTDDEFANELQRRIQTGAINIDDWVEPEPWDGLLHLTYAGEVDIDLTALDEAIVRLQRKQPREALYQLEKAMDGRLSGLADLKPEDLA
ncbi:hypothetical protein [uncultured Devosia sp.]|uniref:hypothetical protein n=1 Tax=uncultured Devosia sp. TaxID=211434 RepID=UPI00261B76D7|nr:hypothetical protein [uncultured Devosia sp.]